ncbi:hypothetical protein Ciccas_009262 [Cichlidogyrus casuarinus]|uniref:Uncharacterized protein n=1 Tax=Cichlidogyrus casuarinus TaxID=1844966 RepID=A0ABD2PXJ5_9PLAT
MSSSEIFFAQVTLVLLIFRLFNLRIVAHFAPVNLQCPAVFENLIAIIADKLFIAKISNPY